MCLLEIGERSLAFGKLHFQNASGDQQFCRAWKPSQAGVQDIDAHLEGLVIERDCGEIEVVVHIVGRPQDGLAQQGHGFGGLALFFMDLRGKRQGWHCVFAGQQRRQGRPGRPRWPCVFHFRRATL